MSGRLIIAMRSISTDVSADIADVCGGWIWCWLVVGGWVGGWDDGMGEWRVCWVDGWWCVGYVWVVGGWWCMVGDGWVWHGLVVGGWVDDGVGRSVDGLGWCRAGG